MKSVWVVSSGLIHEGEDIDGIFSTKEKAFTFAEKLAAKRGYKHTPQDVGNGILEDGFWLSKGGGSYTQIEEHQVQ
jgi:hypothetical protein